MSHSYTSLIEGIADMDNLRAAYASASTGRHRAASYLRFREEAEAELAALSQAILLGEYAPGAPREFWVYEPKKRLISALPFRDRIVQHAACNVVGPLFDSLLAPRCHACRIGHGTHRAADELQSDMQAEYRQNHEVFYLKTDFKSYFPSVDLQRLWMEIDRRITCRRTRALIARFTPRRGQGLPIGNLTSQLWANVYGGIFDRWIMRRGIKHWQRYMDDVVMLDDGHGWRSLVNLLDQARAFAANELHLRLSRWMVANADRGIDFVGYRVWSTHRLLRRASITRARHALKHFRGHHDQVGERRFSAAWLGHARHANAYHATLRLGIA